MNQKKENHNLALFDSVVDCLTTKGCSVTSEHSDAVKRLTLSIRDLLQMLASRIPRSKMPAILYVALSDREMTGTEPPRAV
jgi:hypothetical protein